MKLISLTFLVFFCCGLLFAQQSELSRDLLYEYEGTYEFTDGRRITLGIFDEFNKSLVYLDLRTLKVGALLPVSENEFKDNNDASLTFEFQRDPTGKVVRLKTSQGIAVAAERVMPHKREAVSFNSNGRTLRGDLYLPDRNGKFPVVAFAQGSGPSTRGVAFFTTYFLQLGVGVLTFDKQGAGESEGDWETASFDELSDDIVAGINFLRSRPEIDTKKIGILGNSQGGWVGTMAASKSHHVKFLLMRVGSGENVLDTISHEYRGTLMADDWTASEANQAVQMYREHWTASARSGKWEDGDTAILKYQNEPWFKKIFDKPREKTASSQKWSIWLKKNLYYDSYDYLKKIKVPVLWLMAEKDWNVNSQTGQPRVLAALKEAGNKDSTVKILPNMAHTGLLAKTGYYNEPFSWQYAPGFWDTMAAWLSDHRIAKPQHAK